MDDNYSNELAALERLAQAEEAERQRVTTDNEWTTRDFAALRVDYALLSEQNARLLAFVGRVADYDYDSEFMGGALVAIMGEAAAILSELSGKSEVTDDE